MTNLKVKFCGVEFKNPVVLASGILGVTAASLKNVVKHGAGGVTTKSIWMEEHKGHKNPTMMGTEHFFINAVGLSDAGIGKAKELFGEYGTKKSVSVKGVSKNAKGLVFGAKWGVSERKGGGAKSGVVKVSMRPAPIIASIVAMKMNEFGDLAEEISKLNPDIIEINISCPNVEDEFGLPFACDKNAASSVVKVVKKALIDAGSKIPVIVKLSPNVPNIASIASACALAGADGFCAVNTLGPGMVIDLKLRRPVLTNRVGGVSGFGLKPIAVKCVNDVYRATGLPIIGTGGVMTGEDAIEMMMASARLVGIGTAVYYRDISVFGEVVKEMEEWCRKSGVKDVNEIVGCI